MKLENHVGERLRELRRERGLSLAEVAEGTGISTSFLSVLETGRSDITLGRLMKLVKFFGTSVEELLPEAPSVDASLVRVTRRDWEKARRVPVELREQMTREAARGHHAWVQARRDSDYASFRPYLEM